MERTFLREMSVIKTLTYCWLRGPSLLTELSVSVCVLLRVCGTDLVVGWYPAVLRHPHISLGLMQVSHTNTDTHTFSHVCTSSNSSVLPPSLACTHTHIKHTQAGRGRAKSQESCGLINYHLNETKVMALLSWRTFQRLWPFHPTLLKLSAVWEGEVRAP